jgi:GntR family transcriptional regulator
MPRPAARSRRIAAAIERCIAAGEWLPGELLPSRAELGRRFGVHEQTVRLALGLLRDRGLIESRGERLRPEVAHTPIVRTFTEPDAPWPWASETTPRGTTTASEEIALRLDVNPGVRLHWETEERADPTGRSSMFVTTWWRGRRRQHASYTAIVDAVLIDHDQAAALRLSVDTVALRVVRTRLDEDGAPVETSDLVLPRDRWQIALS